MITLPHQPSGRFENRDMFVSDTIEIVQDGLLIDNIRFLTPRDFGGKILFISAKNVTVTNCVLGPSFDEMDALYDLREEARA